MVNEACFTGDNMDSSEETTLPRKAAERRTHGRTGGEGPGIFATTNRRIEGRLCHLNPLMKILVYLLSRISICIY